MGSDTGSVFGGNVVGERVVATVTVVVVSTAVESECEHALAETSIIAVATQRAPRVPARATRGA